MFYKDVTNLKTVAFLGVCGLVVFLLMVVVDLLYSFWIEDIVAHDLVFWVNIDGKNLFNYLSSISTIILSFNFHSYTFYVYEYLHRPTNRAMMAASSVGFFVTIIVYLTVGIIIYVLYGYGNLETLAEVYGDSNIYLLMNVAFVVNVIMSFPMSFAGLKFYLVGLMEIFYLSCKNSTVITYY